MTYKWFVTFCNFFEFSFFHFLKIHFFESFDELRRLLFFTEIWIHIFIQFSFFKAFGSKAKGFQLMKRLWPLHFWSGFDRCLFVAVVLLPLLWQCSGCDRFLLHCSGCHRSSPFVFFSGSQRCSLLYGLTGPLCAGACALPAVFTVEGNLKLYRDVSQNLSWHSARSTGGISKGYTLKSSQDLFLSWNPCVWYSNLWQSKLLAISTAAT